MKRTPLKRTNWREFLGTREQRQEFRYRVFREDGGCVMTGFGNAVCDGPLDPAHVIPVQRLRRWGYGAEVVYSPDAAFTLCRKHHSRHDSGFEKVPESLWPARCREFVKRINEERAA